MNLGLHQKVKILDHGVDFEEPSDFGEFQLSYRTGGPPGEAVLTADPGALPGLR